MAIRSTYFLELFAICITLAACVSESFVDTDYSASVSGYKRNQSQTANIQPRQLSPANSIAANAALVTPQSNASVIVNNPFAFSGSFAPSPTVAPPVYSGSSPYGSLANSNGVITPGVFVPSYNTGYQPPVYGNTYSPVR